MKSPKDVVESLVELAENWLDGNINPDDITIVATKGFKQHRKKLWEKLLK